MTRTSTASHLGSALRKLLTLLCGVLLFVLLASGIGIWALGRFAPSLLDSALSSKTGARLAVAGNESNLFAGRVELTGLTITNPTRWQEREFLKIRRLAITADAFSFLEGGGQVIHDAELDVDRLVLVGREDYLADNNAKDIFRGLKGPKEERPAAETPKPAGPKRPFRIDHLRVRIGHVVIVAADGSPQRRQVVDADLNLTFEASGITERNFDEKVSKPLGQLAMQEAATRGPEVLLDIAQTKLRRSVTERLQQEEGK